MSYHSSHHFGVFQCAFRIWNTSTLARFLHGYSLSFDVTFEADKLNERGLVVDIEPLDHLRFVIEKKFHYKTLVASDDPDLEWFLDADTMGVLRTVQMPQVGLEHFSCWLAVSATDELMENGWLDQVRVYSARVNQVEYYPWESNTGKQSR